MEESPQSPTTVIPQRCLRCRWPLRWSRLRVRGTGVPESEASCGIYCKPVAGRSYYR